MSLPAMPNALEMLCFGSEGDARWRVNSSSPCGTRGFAPPWAFRVSKACLGAKINHPKNNNLFCFERAHATHRNAFAIDFRALLFNVAHVIATFYSINAGSHSTPVCARCAYRPCVHDEFEHRKRRFGEKTRHGLFGSGKPFAIHAVEQHRLFLRR